MDSGEKRKKRRRRRRGKKNKKEKKIPKQGILILVLFRNIIANLSY